MLPRHARCVLSPLHCNGHRLLLGSYLSRIGRIENPSCSACGHPSQNISHPISHPSQLTLWRLSVSLRPLVQTLGSFPASGAPCFSALPPSLWKGSGNQQQQHPTLCQSGENVKFCWSGCLIMLLCTKARPSFQPTEYDLNLLFLVCT